MRIKVNQKDLLRVLNSAFKAVPNKTATPILENFLLSARETYLTVTASDGKLTISHKCTCESDEVAETVVPAKTLLELTKALPDTDVTIITQEGSVLVDWVRGHSSIPCFPPEDYPAIQGIPDGKPLTIGADVLKNALAHTIPCMGQDELRPQLSGIYFDISLLSTNLVASDTHIMTVCPIEVGEDIPSFILPASAAVALKDAIGLALVEIYHSGNTVRIVIGDYTLTSPEVIGKFPAYKTVMPESNANVLTADKSELIRAIKRIGTCANRASRMLKLTLSQFGSTIEAQDLGFQVSAKESLDFTYKGEDVTVGVKDEYALKAISPLNAETVTMKFSDGRHAILIEGEGDPTRTIMMPITTN